ncbi:MAG TPA: YiiD C-terminal domain-containing protein [Acidimicrobiia bacterium]|nr:YiiD C-terminal domain-containing protein [Acidimicrobiia bacterium]
MDDALRDLLQHGVPFAGFVGVDIADIADGRAVVVLPERPELHNHLGTQHAGALFTAAEAASGAAMVGAFAAQLARVRPVAAEATIRYVRLARGAITATATLDDAPDALRDRLAADGKVRFDATVALTDADGREVAHATVAWHLSSTEGGP